ncbi:SPOR domain-containing protein [Pseudoalteromonas sp. SS15]|uniref:SPOR domain-containing protein n=1 Tax=Pseudoalteromonas sp. SS15 TaxID=3139393 RepID=UPI003BAA5667
MFSSHNNKSQIKACFLLIVCAITLNGCASMSKEQQASLNGQAVTLTQQEYQHLKEMARQWQENKAGIDRLLAYEQTLGVLVRDLNRLVANNDKANFTLADNNQHKQGKNEESADKSSSTLLSQVPRKDKKEEVVISLFKADKPVQEHALASALPALDTVATQEPSSNLLTAKYSVQVASVKSRQKAKQVYKTLRVKLANSDQEIQEARLEPKQIGQQQFYRLKFGAFATKEQAQAVCSQWQKHQVSCFVSQFGGLNQRDWL